MYTKSPKWYAALVQKRKATIQRNINIYLGRDKALHLTTQRREQLKAKVQKMIDNNEIDLSLFE